MRYDYTRLKDFTDENNIILFDDYSSKIINIFTIIEGQCLNIQCNNNFSKSFRSLVKTNGYCLQCSTKTGLSKVKNTLIEKYGFYNPMKSKEIKNKTKQTNFKKYGFEYCSQSQEIKDKVKLTNIEKYGVTCSLHNEQIKEKVAVMGPVTLVCMIMIALDLWGLVIHNKVYQTMEHQIGFRCPRPSK